MGAFQRLPFGPEQKYSQCEEQVDIAYRIGEDSAFAQFIKENPVDGESCIVDNIPGNIQVCQGNDQRITGVNEPPYDLRMDFKDIQDEIPQSERNGQQTHQHHFIPEQWCEQQTVEVHHHGAETPDWKENHIELERPVETILLVL